MHKLSSFMQKFTWARRQREHLSLFNQKLKLDTNTRHLISEVLMRNPFQVCLFLCLSVYSPYPKSELIIWFIFDLTDMIFQDEAVAELKECACVHSFDGGGDVLKCFPTLMLDIYPQIYQISLSTPFLSTCHVPNLFVWIYINTFHYINTIYYIKVEIVSICFVLAIVFLHHIVYRCRAVQQARKKRLTQYQRRKYSDTNYK